MQRSRLLFLAISSAAWGIATGCESEEPGGVGTADFGPGSGASGGRAAGAGSAAADAGTDEDSGGGQLGAGGQSGALGAGSFGSAGQAGASGFSGSAGAAGNGEPGSCAEACSRDQDCGSSLPNQVFRCSTATHRCEGFAAPCRNDAECLPGASQWLWSCNSDQECFFFDDDVCVSVAGVGRCARSAPQPDASGGGCAYPVPDALLLSRVGGAGMVRVCADTTQKCNEGACIVACTGDQQCTPEKNGSVCNRQTGRCECLADADCRGPGVSRCNTATRRCECAVDSDCKNALNADVCIAGSCGCGSVAACKTERTFSGTRYVCE